MALTQAQKTTLKAFIDGNVNINGQPQNSDGAFFIAAYLNGLVSPDFFVYRTSVGVGEINNQIDWAKLTPSDAIPTLVALDNAVWQDRAIACQGMQFNIQIILGGQSVVNATNSKMRKGLQDALSAVPSGVAGAAQSAGWITVRDVLSRKASIVEKLFADTSGGVQDGTTIVKSALMVIEGPVSGDTVLDAMLNG